MVSAKNSMLASLSPAVSDLGLGDATKQSLEDFVAELKKKKSLAAASSNPSAYGDNVISAAANLLGS